MTVTRTGLSVHMTAIFVSPAAMSKGRHGGGQDDAADDESCDFFHCYFPFVLVLDYGYPTPPPRQMTLTAICPA